MTKADRTRIRRQLDAVLRAGKALAVPSGSYLASDTEQAQAKNWNAAVRNLPKWMRQP